MSTTAKIIVGILAAIAILAIIAIVIIVLVGPSEPDPTAEPPTTAPTTPPEAGDDSWDKIEAAGKIVVGTSADYPPFEFYVDDLQIDGFDIAMMDEMGRRLGVSIEYLDYAFDGLGGALQLGQIDLALAAVSVTAERESVVDFSNIYLVGEDAILAHKGSGIDSVGSVDDMAAYRIGVQRGTAYEAWILTELVDTGKMPESNLFVYERAGDAVRDLVQDRLDVVILDLQPAELAVQEYEVKIVGQGLNQQRYAIAFPKGAAALKAKDRRRSARAAQRGHHCRTGQQVPGPGSSPAHANAWADEHAQATGRVYRRHVLRRAPQWRGQLQQSYPGSAGRQVHQGVEGPELGHLHLGFLLQAGLCQWRPDGRAADAHSGNGRARTDL